MRKRIAAAVIAVWLMICVAIPANAAGVPFEDVSPYAWYAENVEYVYGLGLMNGTSENQFSPDLKMTRAMLVTVLHRYQGSPAASGITPFTDLNSRGYYVDAVNWAYENRIVLGTSESTFSPDQEVTREQIVTVFYRFARYLNRELPEPADLRDYPDAGEVSQYAREPFAWAVAAGIIKGTNGKLDPKGSAVRSQCAAIISRFDGMQESGGTGAGGTKLYVLMYHSVVSDDTRCNDWMVTESKFREQMNWLAEHGYTTVLPGELAGGTPLPEKAVLITFDDGYADNYLRAFPILQEYNHRAVIALITANVEVKSHFLTWQMCREMVNSGLIEIASHTHNLHQEQGIRRLNGESKEAYALRVLPDIGLSVRLIKEHLGVMPVAFAYPHGVVDTWADEYLNRTFSVSMITDIGVNDVTNGVRQLRRYNVNDSSDLSKLLAQ